MKHTRTSRRRYSSSDSQRKSKSNVTSKCDQASATDGKDDHRAPSPDTAKKPCPSSRCNLPQDKLPLVGTLLLTLVTMALRVHYVRQETSWWILHPDEIYQSLEVAHSEVYGYGFRTYEFLPPAKGDNLSLYRQREQQLGMHALRSPLYPRFYVAVSWVAMLLEYPTTPYLMWRIAHVIVSSLLPLATYCFASRLFRSRDVGVVAAILVATSVHLSVLGTHTLVHSFLAPVIFASMSGLMSNLLDSWPLALNGCHLNPEKSSDNATSDDSTNNNSLSTCRDDGETIQDQRLFHSCCQTADLTDESDSAYSSSTSTVLEPIKSKRIVDHSTLGRHWNCGLQDSQRTTPVFRLVSDLFDKLCCMFSKYRSMPEINFPFQSDDKRCLMTQGGSKNASDSSSIIQIPRTTDAKSVNGHFFRTKNSVDSNRETPTTSINKNEYTDMTTALIKAVDLLLFVVPPLFFSFCLALALYVRPDGVLLITCLAVPYLHPSTVIKYLQRGKIARLGLAFLGGAAGILVGVADDFHFYGYGVFSPLNWFAFNVLSGSSSNLFGVDPCWLYFREILFKNNGMLLFFVVNVFGFGISLTQVLRKKVDLGLRITRKTNLLLSVVVLLSVYSCQRHKEARFIHHVFVLYFILSAQNILTVVTTIKKHLAAASTGLVTFLIIATFSVSQLYDFPTTIHHSSSSLKDWTHEGRLDNYDVTKCVDFIASQKGVKGVFFDKNIHLSGGYTSLRHNVPILALTNSGYHEFGMASRITTENKLWTTDRRTISVVHSSEVTNYFLPQNAPFYLLQHLIKHPKYNYLVMGAKTDFLTEGYKEVFVGGSVKVVKRIGTERAEKGLRDTVPSLRFQPKADVLESEAKQLYALGLTQLASSRYAAAQKIRKGKTKQ